LQYGDETGHPRPRNETRALEYFVPDVVLRERSLIRSQETDQTELDIGH